MAQEDTVQRKLAAIMFTDMVGYSALAQRNEALALELLEEHRRLLRPIFPKHNGREVETAGDAFLVEFVSALEAVRCAVEIQAALSERNRTTPPERTIRLRIGIHVGDVVHKDDKVMGDAVNIAARLEPLAEPGGICISRAVLEQVQNKVSERLVSLGPLELKNLAQPVEVYRVEAAEANRGAGIGAAGLRPHPRTCEAQRSIAVLPFVNMSSDRENEYLCDGISEDLITALSKVPGLRVAARTSSFAFKGKSEDIRAIGERLSVTTVLEGSGRKVGSRLRITAQLINIADGFHLWSERYDRELQDVFAIQDDITGAIVEALKVKLAGGVGSAERHTKNIEAYQLYLKGRYFWNLRMAAGLTRAIEFFNQALALDPDYAVALAGLADCYNLADYYRVLSPRETFPKAKAAAEKALELNSAFAEPHASIGFAKLFYDWDIEGAEAALERALELDPRYATAHQWHGMCLMTDGRFEEAVAAWRRAQELDPLSLSINASWGWPYYFRRDYDEAIKHFRAALEINPEFVVARHWLGLAYVQKSMYAEALAQLEKAKALSPTYPMGLAALGYAYAVSGQRTAALTVLKELNELAEQRYVSAHDRAVVYTGLGDTEQTLEWLAKAYDEHYSLLVWLKDEPMFDWLRSNQDFRSLLSRIESNA